MHKKLAVSVRKHLCARCSQPFDRLNDLKRHQRTQHSSVNTQTSEPHQEIRNIRSPRSLHGTSPHGLCDPSRCSGDEGLSFIASTPSNGIASGRVNPQDKIYQAFFDLNHESKTILQLFCFLDGATISMFMITRAERPQAIWGSTGETEEVTPIEAGLRSDMLSLISNKSEVKRAIDYLEASKLITSEPGPYGARIVHLDSITQLRLAQYITEPLT